METVADFIFGGSEITADGDCSRKIKRCLLLWRKAMRNLDDILKLPTKVCIVKAITFPGVTYGYESWTIKKAECQRIDAFELWCWRRLLRVLWTARRSNQSIQITVEAQSVDFLLDTGATYSMLTEAPGSLSSQSASVMGLSGRAKSYHFSFSVICDRTLCYFHTSFWSCQSLWARSMPLFAWIWSPHFLSL